MRHATTTILTLLTATIALAAPAAANGLKGYWTTDEDTKDVAPPGSGDTTWEQVGEGGKITLSLEKGEKVWFAFKNLQVDTNKKYFAFRWGWPAEEENPLGSHKLRGTLEDGSKAESDRHFPYKDVEYELDGEERKGRVDQVRFKPQPAWERVQLTAKRDLVDADIDICAMSECVRCGPHVRPDLPIYSGTVMVAAPDAMEGSPHLSEFWIFPHTLDLDGDALPELLAPDDTGPWFPEFVSADPSGGERPLGVRWISDGTGLVPGDEISFTLALDGEADRKYDIFVVNDDGSVNLETTIITEPWLESLDEYPIGPLAGLGDWEPWGGDPIGAEFEVTDDVSLSAPHAMAIDGDDDAVQRFPGVLEGFWQVEVAMFVPADMTDEQHFILLNTYPAGPTHDWSLQLIIDGAAGTLRDRNSEAALPLVTGAWTHVLVIIDLENDTQTVRYEDDVLLEKSWSAGVASGGALRLAALDLYGTGSAHRVYYDNLTLDIASPTGACLVPDAGCDVIDIDECAALGGTFQGFGSTCDAECPADLDGDGAVGFGDLLIVLGAWGECEGCPADLDGNGVVDFGDLIAVLGAWGECST